MLHLISVTFIPDRGINRDLEKDYFLNDIKESSEEFLDKCPVGCSLEFIYDIVKTDINDKFVSVVTERQVVKQTKRGVFVHIIQEIRPEHLKSVSATYARRARLKKRFFHNV